MLIGFGQTGEAVIRQVAGRWLLYRSENDSQLLRAMLISANPGNERVGPDTQRLPVNPAGNRVQVFANNHILVADAIKAMQQILRADRDEQILIVGSLSEKEIGLLQPVLENLFDEWLGQTRLPKLFLVIQSPEDALSHPERFATVREIIQFLYDGKSSTGRQMFQLVYLFDGSKEHPEFYRLIIPSIAETMLTYLSGGTSFLGKDNSVIHPTDSKPAIRSAAACTAIDPILEVSVYFAWRYLLDSWKRNESLLPGPNQSIMPQNTSTFQSYLQSWLGETLAGWVSNPDRRRPPAIEEEQASLQLLKGITNLLSEEVIPDRYSSAILALQTLQENTFGSYPVIYKTSQQCYLGLNHLFTDSQEIENFLADKANYYQNKIVDLSSAPVVRWVWGSAAIRETVDQRYQDLMRSSKNQLFQSLQAATKLEYQFSGDMITWNLTEPFQINEVRNGFKGYFTGLFEKVQPALFDQLAHSDLNWHRSERDVSLFLNSARTMLVRHPDNIQSHHLLLAAYNLQDQDAFPVNPANQAIQFIRRPSRWAKTSLTIFTGLRMLDSEKIQNIADAYSPDENFHITESVKHSAYFESLVPSRLRNNGLFSEELISTLSDRDTAIGFFEAYFAGLLDWNSIEKTWVIVLKDSDDLKLITYEKKSPLTSISYKTKSLETLWEAYHQFAIDIPASFSGGEMYHPLHDRNRRKYLADLITSSVRRGRKPTRLQWLDEQAEEWPDKKILQDFYRLAKAVQAISPKNQ